MAPSQAIDTSALPIVLDGPGGSNKFFVARLDGYEAISELFSFRLDLLSADLKLDLEGVLGKGFTLKVKVPDKSDVFINGICRRVRSMGMEGELARYEMEIVPQLWTAGLRVNSRIFQEKAVPDIVETVLKEHQVKLEKSLSGSYKAREYCVQYQESDLGFACRLLEEEGIFFYFKHENGKHSMVLGDKSSSAPKCQQVSEYKWIHSTGGAQSATFVDRFERERSLRAGAFATSDYNFKTPTTDLTVKKSGKDKPEVYEYPGIFIDRGAGNARAESHLEELEWQRETVNGEGSCRTMRCGNIFTLAEEGQHDGDYLLVQVHHSGSQVGELGSEGGGEEPTWRTTFHAIPSKVAFRPQRLTPKPRIHGAQPAVVVGKKGEEIWTDKYGRIKVQFFWDREGKKDENSSCWIRCAFSVAGKSWGQIFLPRIDQEVLVAFLDGDPDRPLVVGGVYNEVMMPPYTLPGEQTKSTLKSRSSKGGGASNFNEIRFEDKKGSEEVFVQAEKDMHRLVKNDDKLEVKHDQTLTIKNHRTETVEDGNETVTIKKGNRKVTVETGNEDLIVKKGNRKTLVEMGNDDHQVKMGNRGVVIDMGNDTLTIKMGNQTTKLNLGKSSTEAMQSIELKVMGNSIKIDPSGITLKGIMVKIEGQAMCDVKAPMTQVTGSGMLKMGGGITMIG